MSESKPPTLPPEARAAAARAFADRATGTGSRISALVADAGLACRFQSILTTAGSPFAEIARLFAADGEFSHNEKTILRNASLSELVKGAAAFRQRAAAEFAAAPGIPPAVKLFLPYYCALPEVEALGPSLADVLAQHRLPPSRVISELVLPTSVRDMANAIACLSWLRAVGVNVAVRIDGVDPSDLGVVAQLKPDYVHLVAPPRSFDETQTVRALLATAPPTILGGLAEPDDSNIAESLGVPFLYGDTLAPPRFLT